MGARVQGERDSVPELEEHMAQTVDRQLAELAAGLAAGFGLRGRGADRVRALIRLALELWTWRRLDREGYDDEAAAELMTGSLQAVARSIQAAGAGGPAQ